MRARRRVALSGAVACALLLSAAALEGVATPTLAVGSDQLGARGDHDYDLRRHVAVHPAVGRHAGTDVPHVGHDHLVSGAVGIGTTAGQGPTR